MQIVNLFEGKPVFLNLRLKVCQDGFLLEYFAPFDGKWLPDASMAFEKQYLPAILAAIKKEVEG